MSIERRSTGTVRASSSSNERIIRGIGAAYGNAYDVGWFREKFASGAFAESIKADGADVRCFFNHDPNMVLGRMKSGTLNVRETDAGLEYECTPPDTDLGNEIWGLVKRGDVDAASIGFRVIDDVWEDQRDDKGRVVSLRTVKKAELIDVGPVTYPANPMTTASVRALFPSGIPAEVRSRIEEAKRVAKACACQCLACKVGECDECINEACIDTRCVNCAAAKERMGYVWMPGEKTLRSRMAGWCGAVQRVSRVASLPK